MSSPWALTTLQRAARLWPDQELVFVVGSDLAAQIPRWRQADAVLNLCRLAIAPRQGWPLQPEALEALKHRGASIELLDLAVPASASSDLRQAPRQDQVPQRVWPLLIEHGLYGLTPNRC